MKLSSVMLSLSVCGVFAAAGMADDFSFTGTFTQDDNVQQFNFAVGAPSTVTLRTYSYAGGTNAAGQVIPRGGFDPILALFDGAGNLLNQNDDGGCGKVPADSGTGMCWDTYLQSGLAPGNYSVTVMEYDNFANGPNLANGFTEQGNGNFTPQIASNCQAAQFCDVSGVSPWNQRDSHWAFDILNVASATEVVPSGPPANSVPEPGTLTALALAGLSVVLHKRRRARA